MTNKDLLFAHRAALEKSIQYFSQKKKGARERWVANEFLENLGIVHEDADLVSSLEDPPDVLFRDCRFEIKEILEPGRKRHDEYKQKYEKVLQAKHPRDLIEKYTPRHYTPEEIGKLVEEECLSKYNKKYPSGVRQNIDLLFYVNYIDYYQRQGTVPCQEIFAKLGWRSISVLEGWSSIIFFANNKAPLLLQENIGSVHHRNISHNKSPS